MQLEQRRQAAEMELTIWNKHKEWFQVSAASQWWEIIENTNEFLFFFLE